MSAALRLPVIVDDGAAARPRTRGECQNGERPCPWVSCTEHAIHGVLMGHPGGDIGADAAVSLLETMPETCTLDVADQGDAGTLEAVSNMWGITRERIRQIEGKALVRLDRRVGRLRDVIVEEHASELRPRSCGPVPASESRGWTDPSPRYAHLPGPAEVDAAETEFWCGHMGTALAARLCTRRHLARHRVSSDRVVKTYPECARCTDGAGIAARLGATEAPVPQREAAPPPVPEPGLAAAAPVPEIGRLGGDDDRAQVDAEQLAVVEPDVASEVPAEVHRDVKPSKPRKQRAAPVQQRATVVRVRVRVQPEHPVVALIQAFATRARKVRRA